MGALLRKEVRERAPWAAALCLATAIAACSHGYTFYGSPGLEMLTWSFGPVLLACLLGSSAYNSEMTADRAAFLLTRPVSWKKIALAKAVTNVGILVLAAAVSAIAYRLSCPEPYLHFATSCDLLVGAAYSLALTGAAFFVGFGCGTALPGLTGGAILLFIVASSCFTLFGLIRNGLGGWPWVLMQFVWPLACVAGSISVVRFGLTLSTNARALRYAAMTTGGMIVLAVLLYLAPQRYVNGLSGRLLNEVISWSISPDGRYALGRDLKNVYWLDVQSGQMAVADTTYEDYSASRGAVCWRAPHTAFRIAFRSEDWSIRTYRPGPNGATVKDIHLGKLPGAKRSYPYAIMASPDGRVAAIKLSGGMAVPPTAVFLDTATWKLLPESVVLPAGSARWWWQTPRSLGYLDEQRRPKVLRLAN